MENDKIGSSEQVEQTKDSMRTSSATSPFPEFGDGSGYTTYSNNTKTSTPELTPFDPEFGTDDNINTPRRYAKEDSTQEPLVLKTGKTPFDIEYGTDENEVTKKEAKAKEIKANEDLNKGFDPNAKFSKEGQKFASYEMLVSENAKLEEQNKALMEQNKLMMERMNNLDAKYNMLLVVLTQGMPNPTAVGTVPYNQDPTLATALDPNRVRPLDPLEDVKNKTIAEQDKKAQQFVDQVKEEDRLHNPLNPANVQPTPTGVTNPELQNTTAGEAAKKAEDEARERSLKKATILGAVIGGATVLAAGTGVVVPAVIVCAVGGLASRGLEWVGGKRIEALGAKIAEAKKNGNTEIVTKLEKRSKGWEKVRKGCKYVTRFFTGGAIGVGIGSLISGAALGGHGLVWNRPEAIIPTPTNPTGPSHIEPRTPTVPETGGAGGGAESSPEIYQGNDFIDKNGVIHANGSPWDSTQVAQPTGNLPGEANNINNFEQGEWGKAPSVVDNFLKQHNVTDTSYLDGYDRDRILDETWLAIKGGNTNPDITEILKHVGTEGTTKLLTTIGQ